MSKEEAWSYHDLFSKKAKKVQELEHRIAEAVTYANDFCDIQCEEGPGWGECESSRCHISFIKKALSPSISNSKESEK